MAPIAFSRHAVEAQCGDLHPTADFLPCSERGGPRVPRRQWTIAAPLLVSAVLSAGCYAVADAVITGNAIKAGDDRAAAVDELLLVRQATILGNAYSPDEAAEVASLLLTDKRVQPEECWPEPRCAGGPLARCAVAKVPYNPDKQPQSPPMGDILRDAMARVEATGRTILPVRAWAHSDAFKARVGSWLLETRQLVTVCAWPEEGETRVILNFPQVDRPAPPRGS